MALDFSVGDTTSGGGGATATSGGGSGGGFDWNTAFQTAIGAGFEVWDRSTYTEQERARDEMRAQPVNDGGGSGGGSGGMDQQTMMLVGGAALALVLVLVAVK